MKSIDLLGLYNTDGLFIFKNSEYNTAKKVKPEREVAWENYISSKVNHHWKMEGMSKREEKRAERKRESDHGYSKSEFFKRGGNGKEKRERERDIQWRECH